MELFCDYTGLFLRIQNALLQFRRAFQEETGLFFEYAGFLRIRRALVRYMHVIFCVLLAANTINSQMPEITIALHERVESYIKELQVRQ